MQRPRPGQKRRASGLGQHTTSRAPGRMKTALAVLDPYDVSIAADRRACARGVTRGGFVPGRACAVMQGGFVPGVPARV